MEKSIVKIQNNDLIVSSWDLSIGFDLRHRRVRDLITEHKDRLEKYGELKLSGIYLNNEQFTLENEDTHGHKLAVSTDVKKRRKTKKSGGQIKQYIINYDQYICLLTILPNTEKCLNFKFQLADDFLRMRKILIKDMVQKQNSEWQEQRRLGIISRLTATDAIDDFVKYAEKSGSKSFKMYYRNFTIMQHDCLLAKEMQIYGRKDVRKHLDRQTLNLIELSDNMISQQIAEGIKNQIHYKDLYQHVKTKTEGFAMAVGRTPLRLMEKL